MIIRWYLGGFVAAAAIGWATAKCHLIGWAPIGLLSLAAGILLGLALTKWATLSGFVGTKHLVVGAVLLGLATVFFEHAWLYADFRRQWQEARATNPQVALFRPEVPWSPREYFNYELSPRRAALWCADAVLLIVGSVGTVLAKRNSISGHESFTPDP